MRPIYIVLLPGLDGTGLLFRPLIEKLPAYIKPIVVNYPTDEKLGYADLLPLALNALPKNEPFILLGESFSGPLSIMLAASKPPGLKAVVLSTSFVTCPQRLIPKWTELLVFATPFRTSVFFAKIGALFGEYYSDELKQALSSVKPEVFAHRLREVIKVNVEAELASCKLPILYLQGKHDFMVSSTNLARIKELKPDVQYVQLETSHLLLQTNPSDAANSISSFIETL